MRKNTRLIIATALAAVAILAITNSASAIRSIDVEPAGTTIRLTAARLTFGGTIDIICNFTLGISLHQKVGKVTGALAGTVTEGRVNTCRDSIGSGEPTTRVSLLVPMHIQYDSITGELPEITGGTLRVVGGFLTQTNFFGTIGCLYTYSLPLIAAENPVRALRIGANTYRLSRTLQGTCPRGGEMSGSFTADREIELILLE